MARMTKRCGAWLALAGLCVLPSTAAADTLYKCVDAAAIPSIQNEPCGKGQTQVWARETAPEPPPTPEQLAAAQARAAARERARIEEQARLRDEEEARRVAEEAKKAQADKPPESPAPPPADPCDEAKAFVAQVRDKPWLQMEDAQMQRLYGWVTQQCAAPAKAE
jgi:hypothetical protein